MEPLERVNMKIAREENELEGRSNQMARSVMDGRGRTETDDEAACSCAPGRRRLLQLWWWYGSRLPLSHELRFSDGLRFDAATHMLELLRPTRLAVAMFVGR